MKFVVVSTIVGAGILLSAHDVFSTKITWSREISRVVYKRCGSCHREGGTSFPLMSFEQVRPWAKAIKEEVLERRMPPFGAVKGFCDLRDDQALTQEEIHLISDWVEGGSPEGDRALLPHEHDFGHAATNPPKTGAAVVVNGSVTLPHPVTVAGVRPRNMREGSSVRVVAERPDGSIEPLIWLYNYKAAFDQAYYFRTSVSFPAGTKIETYPAGGVSLLLQK